MKNTAPDSGCSSLFSLCVAPKVFSVLAAPVTSNQMNLLFVLMCYFFVFLEETPEHKVQVGPPGPAGPTGPSGKTFVVVIEAKCTNL